MARTPWHFIFPFMMILFITACGTTQRMTMSTQFPNLNAARANCRAALDYLHQGYTNLAQERIVLALDQAPRDPLVLDSAGYYYEKTGNLDLANRYFLNAVLLNPHSALANNNYGAFLCRNNRNVAPANWYFQTAAEPKNDLTREAKANAAYCTQKMQFMLGDQDIYAYHMSQQKQLHGN